MQGRRYIDPKVKTRYLEWLMTPPGEREPSSKEAFAEAEQVSSRTLYNWEQEDEFQEALRSLKVKWGNRWYPDILQSLMDTVLTGPPAQRVAAAKVLLQHIDIKEEANTGDLDVDNEAVRRISEALRAAGYTVISD